MDELLMLLVKIIAPVLSAFLVGLIYKRMGVENMRKIEAELNAKRDLAMLAIKLAEQAYKDLKGEEKYLQASVWFSAMATERGFKISDSEVRGFIEAAIREMKDSFGEDWGNVTKNTTK